MSTYDERWVQAHKFAQWHGDLAYKQGRGKEEMAMLYHKAYTREMAAFDALEALRQNAPNQAAVDEMAASLLKAAPAHEMPDERIARTPEEARAFGHSTYVPDECPECGTVNLTGHCARCDYQLEA